MNSTQVKQLISTEIDRVFTESFIEAEQPHKKPAYPFATFQVLLSHINEYEHDNIERRNYNQANQTIDLYKLEQPQMTMTINAYARKPSDPSVMDTSIEDATDLAQRLKDWFDFEGDLFLNKNQISVIESEDITQRDVLIIDNYERRYGFDVRLRYNREINFTIETIENTNIERTGI